MELFNKKNIELKNLSFALLVLLPISFIIGSFFVNLLVTIIAFLFFLYQKSDQTKNGRANSPRFTAAFKLALDPRICKEERSSLHG